MTRPEQGWGRSHSRSTSSGLINTTKTFMSCTNLEKQNRLLEQTISERTHVLLNHLAPCKRFRCMTVRALNQHIMSSRDSSYHIHRVGRVQFQTHFFQISQVCRAAMLCVCVLRTVRGAREALSATCRFAMSDCAKQLQQRMQLLLH